MICSVAAIGFQLLKVKYKSRKFLYYTFGTLMMLGFFLSIVLAIAFGVFIVKKIGW